MELAGNTRKALKNNVIFLNCLGILLIIAIGTIARFFKFEFHFSHVDDIGVAKHIMDYVQIGSKEAFTAIPRKWTYAPLQFYITPLLFSPEMSYRDLLFWGRLPSALFSSLSLIFMAYFYWLYDRWKTHKVLIGLSLLALSWENIVYAKQMHNYALGLMACVILLILVLFAAKKQKTNYFFVVILGFFLALLSWAQYQIIFFLPAFFLSYLIYRYLKVGFKHAFLEAVCMGIVTVSLVFPLWQKYLSQHLNMGMGVSWNEGNHLEYLFQFNPDNSFIQNIFYPITFFVRNFFIIFETNTSFVDPKHALQGFLYYLNGFFFFFGVFSFFLEKNKILKRKLGYFLVINALVWIGLVCMQKITLSPTRHSLILLPFMTILCAEGAVFMVLKIKRYLPYKIRKINRFVIPVTVLFFIAIFLSDFSTFNQKRQDLFIEDEIVQTLLLYNPDAMVKVHAIQPIAMRKVQRFFGDYEFFFPTFGVIGKKNINYQRIAWVSGLFPLSKKIFEEKRREINLSIAARNSANQAFNIPRTIPFFSEKFEDYQIIYKKEINRGVEVDYNPRIGKHDNAIYFYILDKIKK